ncbi:MAG: glycosyltransferase family 2 protein [Planctomycetota bacterium]
MIEKSDYKEIAKQIEFSIILPVFHGGSFLNKALESIRQIDFPPDSFEILIASNTDSISSRKIVESQAALANFAIRYINSDCRRRSFQLNAACAAAKGRILVFTDDDCLFFSDWLHKFLELFRTKPEIGIIGGADEIVDHGSGLSLALDCVLASPLVTGRLRKTKESTIVKYYPKLYNMAIMRSVALDAAFENQDGIPEVFDSNLIVHEDIELATRIEAKGKSLVYAPHIRVRHYRDTTLLSFIFRNFHLARTCRTLRVHRFAQTALTFFVITVLALGISSLFISILLPFFLAVTILYGVPLLLTAIIGMVRKKRLFIFAAVPFLLICLHFARGLGYLFPWCNHSRSKNSNYKGEVLAK